MKPASFDYHRATNVDEAVEMLAALGEEAKILAGGQSLIPLMAFRLARPTDLVDINPIRDLSYVRRDDDTLVVGALTRHRQIERLTDRSRLDGFDVLPRAAEWIGHDPIRTRGTFGGSIAHADPTAEWCLLALVFDAEVVARGPSGTRVIRATEFFRGFFTTALASDELAMTRDAQSEPAAGVRRGIAEAIASLSRGQREAFMLVEWLGLSSEEAGRVLGIAPASVGAGSIELRRPCALG